MKSFKGKVAAITGAGSGIGRELAIALAKQRCHLSLSDINVAALEQTRNSCVSLGVNVSTHEINVADRDAMLEWAEATQRIHGHVNLLFNNAGVGQSGTVEDTSLDDYDWLLGINLWGVIIGTKAFMPYLKDTRDGHIVNISSAFGLQAQPGASAYNTSKFAVRGFTESLRQELDLLNNGVSATCVHPGGIKTNIMNNSRVSDSSEALMGMNAERLRSTFNRALTITPEVAAKQILNGVLANRRRVLIGAEAYAIDLSQRILPTGYQLINTIGLRVGRSLLTKYAS